MLNPTPQSFEQLCILLKSEKMGDRVHAAQELGKLGNKEAITHLLEVLHDEDENVRAEVVISLGKLEGKAAIEPLLGMLQYRDEKTILAIWVIMHNHGDNRLIEPLFRLLQEDLDGNSGFLFAILIFEWGDKSLTDSLIPMLHDSYPWRRAWATFLLGGFEVFEPLIELLNDADENVREYAVGALSSFNDKRLVEPFIELLKSPSRILIYNAIVGLGNLVDKRAYEPLLELLKTQIKDFEVYCKTIWALGKLGDVRAVAQLSELTRDKDENVRWWAVKALEDIGDVSALPALEWARKNDFSETDFSESINKAAIEATEKINQANKE